jgi:hypothetical protein
MHCQHEALACGIKPKVNHSSLLNGSLELHALLFLLDGSPSSTFWGTGVRSAHQRVHAVYLDAQGQGVTDRDARQNVMRHTTQKLRSVLNGERSEYHSDWLTSNRWADSSRGTCDKTERPSPAV